MKIKNEKKTIGDVLLVPNLKKNLLLISQLAKKKILVIIFYGDRCYILNKKDNYHVIVEVVEHNKLDSTPLIQCIPLAINIVKTSYNNNNKIWHSRYGHNANDRLEKLQKFNMVTSLPKISIEAGVFEGCLLGK